MAQRDQPSLATQDQDLLEQSRQGREVPTAEHIDGPEVRHLEPRDGRKVHSLNAGLGYLPGREYPLGIGVEEKGHHHGRVERWVAPVLAIAVEDRRKIQLLDDEVPHEVRGMPLRDELRDFRGQQPFLLGVPGAEGFGHTY
jgi:hypothetical protein